MKHIETIISFIFTKKFYHKAIAYWLLILFLYLFKDFALLFFLTFIFAYLFYSGAVFLRDKIYSYIEKKIILKSKLDIFKKIFSLDIIIIIEYIIFLFLIIWIVSSAIPKIQNELTWLSHTIPVLWDQINHVKSLLSDINKNYSEIDLTFKNAINSNQINYDVILKVFEKVKTAWSVIFQFIFWLLLSFIFLLDRCKLKKYLHWIKKSSFSFLYKEYKVIFDKIVRSFWLILKAQSIIAFINSMLTIIWLFIIGFIFLNNGFPYFPYLLTLWLIVFLFWFIPVVWVFLSSIPIIIVWYTASWWIWIVIAIILLVLIIHTIEAYILNPKIVSNFLELPISLTFVILLIWEHFFGIAWLLVWVSLFYFIAELLKDIDDAILKKHKIKKIEKKLLKRVKKSA